MYSFLSMTALFSLFLLALLYPSTYSFLLSWLPFLAILKIPLVSFSSVSGHICMHAHTPSVKVKSFILVLTVAIKGAPTKCCNPLIIWLPTHSMQGALPLAIDSFSLAAFVCMRREQDKGKLWNRMCERLVFVTLCWEVWRRGIPGFPLWSGEAWWPQGIGQLKSLFMSLDRFGGHVRQFSSPGH